MYTHIYNLRSFLLKYKQYIYIYMLCIRLQYNHPCDTQNHDLIDLVYIR